MKHFSDAFMKGIKIGEFYGDGAFSVNDLFTILHSSGTSVLIKIGKNASLNRYMGSKYRKKAIRDHQNLGFMTI